MYTPNELLVRLHDHGIYFLRAGSHRLLQVLIPHELRKAALDIVANLANRPEARGPVFLLDDDGWSANAQQLREQYVAWRAYTRAGDDGWSELDEEPASVGLTKLAEQLGQVVLARPDDGEVIIALASSAVARGPTWSEPVLTLVKSERLSSVRWILVDVDDWSLPPDAIDDRQVVREALISRPKGSVGTSGPSSTSRRLRRGASPSGAQPPPRRGQLRSGPGKDPASLPLAENVLDAARAMHSGQARQGIEAQCRARDIGAQTGDVPTMAAMELVLGGYLLATASPTQALVSFERAVALAKDARDYERVAVGLLAVASCRMVRGDEPGALVAYAEGASLAQSTASTTLLVEACRATGDLAFALGMEAQAVAFWSRAIKRSDADPEGAPASAVARCLRSLEQLCERRGVTNPLARLRGGARGGDAPGATIVMSAAVDDSSGPLRDWTPEEADVLRRSTLCVVDEDTTLLLTPEEIASIHGWTALQPPRAMRSRTVVLVPGGDLARTEVVGGTEVLSAEELEKLRRGAR